MEDKRIEEIKDMMYKVVGNSSYTLQVEAAKAYAMLCMAQQNTYSEKTVTPHTHIDGTPNAIFTDYSNGVLTFKLTE